ncbi:hypothetical protein [Streptomyces californicus]|uniref:hypothetical protein n=1 Tax=Streptomyces californicus TaxID=67351 RepID=UPI00369CFA87
MDIGLKIAALEKAVQELQRSARLSSAALDDTALLVRDGTGSLRGIVGQQGDGTTAVTIVNGAPPPAPATPTAAPALGGISVGWGGTFANGAVIPLDWARVEVHASPADGFTPDSESLVATIETAQGGIVYIPATTPQYVRLVARNTSGSASPATAQVGPYTPKPVAGEIGIGEITETLIADGAVTTPKVFANAVTTPKLAAGSVDATALRADAITGKIITGGQVNGAVVTGGIVRTGTSGQRIVLNPQAADPSDPASTVPAVELHSGAAAQTAPGVLSAQVTDDSSAYPYASLRSPSVANIGPGGQPVNSELRLLSSQPGIRGGSFSVDANPNPYNSESGASRAYGYTANGTTGTSSLELYCADGVSAPGGTGLLGPRTYVTMSGSEIRLRARNSTSDLSMYIRPAGINIQGRIFTDSDWSTLTPASGWSGYGGNYGPGRFRLMPDGSIVLRDLMRRTATTTIANGNTIATLPAAYRPTTWWQQTAWVGGTTGGSCALNINPDGTITLTNLTSGAISYLSTGSGYISLNNYSYFLD